MHIKKDHNLWNYINFLVHLKMKDETEFTGTESYCAELLATDDINWIPLHKSIVLGSQSKNEEKRIQDYLNERIIDLEGQVKEMIKLVKNSKKD